MPIVFEYDEENNILYEKGEGTISLDEFIEYREKLAGIKIRSGLRCLADYREAVVNYSYDEMWSALTNINKVADNFEDIRIAICASDDLGFGMARMYSSITENNNYKTNVFRSIEDACVWLGINYNSKLLRR